MKHKILVLGTFHMAGSCDLHGEKREGIFSPESQSELAQLRTRLAGFAPTKIAVEWEKTEQPALDRAYQEYLDGTFPMNENEIFQIAFPLARTLDHDRLYAVDWMDRGVGLRGCGDVWEYAQQKEPALAAQLQQWEAAGTEPAILDTFRTLNGPRWEADTKAYYVNYARIGVEDDYYGLGWLMWWYQRNLIQFANLSKLAESGREERILFLVGSAHRGILTEFLGDSQLFEVIDPMHYLK